MLCGSGTGIRTQSHRSGNAKTLHILLPQNKHIALSQLLSIPAEHPVELSTRDRQNWMESFGMSDQPRQAHGLSSFSICEMYGTEFLPRKSAGSQLILHLGCLAQQWVLLCRLRMSIGLLSEVSALGSVLGVDKSYVWQGPG